LAAGLVTMLALMLSMFFVHQPVRWHVGASFIELDPVRLQAYTGLLLMPFLRLVSYQARRLLIMLVPFYGAYLAAEVVWRLLCLPRRDWVPRYDELPRVVRIPRGRGDYVLRPSFEDAEALRSAWCVDPGHEHPYATWSDAHLAGCAARTRRLNA
jgi:hypothetical protein